MENAFVIVGGVLGLVGFVVSLFCVAMIAGFTRSTHTVQYIDPKENELQNAFKDEAAEMERIARENEEALLAKVGKKKPTVVKPADEPIEEVNKSNILY